MRRIAAWTLPPLALLAGLAAAGEDEPQSVTVGDPAPAVRLNDQKGRAVRLAEYGEDAWTIVAFYPKSLTPG